MATPLFFPSESELKAALRLTAVPASLTDFQSIFDAAVLQARLRFQRELGVTRVNVILGTSYTAAPTTEAQVIRALGAVVEQKMVFCALLRALPHTWMDSSGDVERRWNDSPLLRERGESELAEELARCENEIVDGLAEMADPNTGECNAIRVFDGSPTCPAPRVGQSLNPLYRRNPFGTVDP